MKCVDGDVGLYYGSILVSIHDGTTIPLVEAYKEFGGRSYLWGLTSLTPTIVNSEPFGALYAVTHGIGNNDPSTIYVNHVRMTVCYIYKGNIYNTIGIPSSLTRITSFSRSFANTEGITDTLLGTKVLVRLISGIIGIRDLLRRIKTVWEDPTNMTTRNVVPRTTNTGQVGTTIKRWLAAFINAITAQTVEADDITTQVLRVQTSFASEKPLLEAKVATSLADAPVVLTAAQLLGGLFTITPTANRILTTDTAANIIDALPAYVEGTTFDFTIVNLAAFNVTLAAGSGVTLVGGAIINNAAGTWKVRVDSTTAITIYRV